MYCCACCKHFRDTLKEGNDGYCNIFETDVRLEDVCDAFKVQGKKKVKGGSKMTNREWINSLSNEDMAVVLCTRPCEMCIYNPDCQGKTCADGVTEWLNTKHKKTMPVLEVGDIIYSHYPKTDNKVRYVYLGNDVMWCDKDECFVRLEDEMKDYVKRIVRKNEDFTNKVIWGADDGV